MRTVALTILLAALACTQVWAENWPQWRGPFFNGSTSEQDLPDQWSKTQNIDWSVDLPGRSAATPVIWGDYVFVSSTDERAGALLAICLDRKTGKELWQRKVSEGIRRDRRSTFAAPSPSTDGKQVVFFYSNGELASFDFKGRKQWSRNIQRDYGDFAFLWTFSSSPLLYQGKLYLQVLQRDVPVSGRGRGNNIQSYLLGMNPATGKTLWKITRPSKAVAESREAFSTPIPHTYQGRSELLVMGGDALTGHDLSTGKELWRWETYNPRRIGHWRLVPSPVAGKGIILACAPKKDPIFAIKAGSSGKLAWDSDSVRAVSSDVPTPLFYEEDFFVLSDVTRTLSRVEPTTGKVKWTIDTPGRSKFEASPTGADGKIYLMNFKGEVVIVSAQSGKILRTIPMGDDGDDQIRSSISVSQGQLFIRTNRKLYCVGK